MVSSGRLPWLRLTAEGILTVVSILSALAVDTFWSGRQDRALEKAELLGIQNQLLATKQQLEETIRVDETLLGYTERLLAILEGAGDGVDNAFRNLIRQRRFFDRVLLGREQRLLARLEELLNEPQVAIS